MRRPLLIVCAWALLGFIGCKQPFQPKGPFEEKMVVYCILSNTSDLALARIYANYDVPGFNPLVHAEDVSVLDAQVTISLGATQYVLHDTVLDRTDRSRYRDSIHAYVYHPFLVKPAKTYELLVTSPAYGSSAASVTVPDTGRISIRNPYVLDDPDLFEYQDLVVECMLSPIAQGFLMRAYLVYEIDSAGTTVVARQEVPSAFLHFTGTEFTDPVFPQLTRRKTSETAGRAEAVSYSLPAFSYAKANLLARQSNSNIKAKTALFVLTQVEQQLYNYYNIVNGFQDQWSIRVDEPDYTNIWNGFGVFGSFVEQQVSIQLRHDLW